MNKVENETPATIGTSGVNFTLGSTTSGARTFITGTPGAFNIPPRTGNTLNQEVTGLSSFNPNFPPSNPVPFSREYININSNFTRPATTI